MRGERLFGARQHVGDGALGEFQAEQAVEHLDHAIVADHLAGVQIGHERDDTGTERTAGIMLAGGFAATRVLQHGQWPLCRLIRVVMGLIGGKSMWS